MATVDLLNWLQSIAGNVEMQPYLLVIGAFFVSLPTCMYAFFQVPPTLTNVPEVRRGFIAPLRAFYTIGMVYGWYLTYVGVLPLVAYLQGVPVGDWGTALLFIVAGAILQAIGSVYFKWSPFAAILVGLYGTGQVFGWLSAAPPILGWLGVGVSMVIMVFVFAQFVEDIQKSIGSMLVNILKPIPLIIGVIMVLQAVLIPMGSGLGPILETYASMAWERWF